MPTHPSSRLFFIPVLLLLLPLFLNAETKWKYQRLGSPRDSTVQPAGGFALMGGGSNLHLAFKYLCEHANGGDFLVLSANDDDAYLKKENEQMKATCVLNSAATLSFASREDSDDPKILEIIAHAESIFIAGGDQSDYVRYWQATPVEAAINRHIALRKPIGGSSAGLAILGQFSFSSMIDTIHSEEALADPYGNKVTLTREFLTIPLLEDTITDTHFVKRDRLGRLLVFMARILKDGWTNEVRAIAVEENAAVLIEPDGLATVVGSGPAYFLESRKAPEICAHKQALTFEGITVERVRPNQTFQLKSWQGQGERYTLSVETGVLHSSSTAHNPY